MVPSNRGHRDAMRKALGQMPVPENMVHKDPDVVPARKVQDVALVPVLVPDVVLAPALVPDEVPDLAPVPDEVPDLDLVPDVVHHLVPVHRADRY